MEDLVKLIITLRTRIEEYGADLRRNEALTRSVLIDPLLRRLGWDTSDPAQVRPEYSIQTPHSTTKADYALFAGSDKPAAIVEAKKLGESSLSDAAYQAMNYCAAHGYEYFAVTDGQRWTVYETRKQGNLQEKQTAQFDLCLESLTSVCLKALSLWRQRFVEGTPADVETGVVVTHMRKPFTAKEPASSASEVQMASSGDWILLSDLEPERGTSPEELRLPSGEAVGATSWAELVTKLTKWLSERGHLSSANLPISTKGKTNLVAEEAKHRDGQPFSAARKADRLWVETKFSAPGTATNMRKIVESAGQNHREFAVRVRKPD